MQDLTASLIVARIDACFMPAWDKPGELVFVRARPSLSEIWGERRRHLIHVHQVRTVFLQAAKRQNIQSLCWRASPSYDLRV